MINLEKAGFTLEQVKEFWDSVAGIYEKENAKVHAIHNQRFTEAVKHLQMTAPSKLLNIWSRDGGAIPYLYQTHSGVKIVHCELSPMMIAAARKRYPEETFIECSLHRLPFPGGSFDAVLSLETLEHVPEPQTFLSEINRVLKKGGQLVMSLPPARAEILLKIYGLFFGGHGEGPHRFLASREVKSLLSQTGFKLLLHKPTVYLPLINKYLNQINKFLEDHITISFLQEFAIRQFYICRKD